jgi:hypothetical protein
LAEKLAKSLKNQGFPRLIPPGKEVAPGESDGEKDRQLAVIKKQPLTDEAGVPLKGPSPSGSPQTIGGES